MDCDVDGGDGGVGEVGGAVGVGDYEEAGWNFGWLGHVGGGVWR